MLMVDCWRVKQYSYSQAIINLRWSCKENLNISHRYVEGLFISSQKVRLLDCTDSHDWSIINGIPENMFLFLITWFIILLNSLTIFLLTKLKIYSDFFFTAFRYSSLHDFWRMLLHIESNVGTYGTMFFYLILKCHHRCQIFILIWL